MSEIKMNFHRSSVNLKEISFVSANKSIEELIDTLKKAKDESNAFLTTLVEQQKGVQVHKKDAESSSDEDDEDNGGIKGRKQT